MSSQAQDLWNSWRSSPEIQEIAEAWITKPETEWTDEDEALYALFQSAPDRAMAAMLAIMQITDDERILGSLAAGPLEDFLAAQGETYIEIIHELALQHRRLREVLDGVWEGAMPKHVWRRVEVLKERKRR